ncbi:hypothetical protein BRADI_5g03770v3 [Brachypodium distachyon]|uniref:Uncharacterized protein n=1 Tax=Brachypodium distachyon TaxID=15368 RepID=A0A2K2CFD6_BRADI|nr:hypothetical protein BRADI_5g03770v3 [Brachypodium distachyon]
MESSHTHSKQIGLYQASLLGANGWRTESWQLL